MRLIPAIDLLGGRVVRLAQGDYDQQTVFDADPVRLARTYAEAGAEWLHVVDLDAARDGGEANLPVIEGLCRDAGLKIQTGGGVRDRADLERRFDAGAARVVVGSLCVHAPEKVCGWLEVFGAGSIVAALDVRLSVDGQWLPQAAGWRESGGLDLWELLEIFASGRMPTSQPPPVPTAQGEEQFSPPSRACGGELNCPPPRSNGGELEGGHLLCTDISRDGMLSGPNTGLYREIKVRFPGLQLQASGGVGASEHLQAVADAGAGTCIVGRALLEGKIETSEITRWSR